MEVIMYTTHCPQCNILAKKLAQKNILYKEVDDIEEIRKLDIAVVPMLSIDGAAPINFKESVNWINSLEV